MHGNVWEWCDDDWYRKYGEQSVTDPRGTKKANYRVDRGGGWAYDRDRCRAAFRGHFGPRFGDDCLGFRVATVLPSQEK